MSDIRLRIIARERGYERSRRVAVDENDIGLYLVENGFYSLENIYRDVEKRLLILKQLSIRPSYGQELSKKLELTPATVKHHLNLLEEMELVKINKSEHKVYYSLNRETLMDRMQDVKDFLS